MSWPRPQSPAVAMMSKSEEKEESCKKKTSEGEEMKHQAVNSLKYIEGKKGEAAAVQLLYLQLHRNVIKSSRLVVSPKI